MSLLELMLLGDLGTLRGTASNYWSAIALTDSGEHQMTEEHIIKSFEWWNKVASDPSTVGDNSWLLFELFSCCDNLTGRTSSAWPRPVGYKHMLLLGTGWGLNGPSGDQAIARKYIVDAHQEIIGTSVEEVVAVPNGLEDFHNVKIVYGEHYSKLRAIKTRVDSRNRLKGHFDPYDE